MGKGLDSRRQHEIWLGYCTSRSFQFRACKKKLNKEAEGLGLLFPSAGSWLDLVETLRAEDGLGAAQGAVAPSSRTHVGNSGSSKSAVWGLLFFFRNIFLFLFLS